MRCGVVLASRVLPGDQVGLHLLQVSLVYVNTLMMQRVLSEPGWMQRLTSEDLRALTPLVYLHSSFGESFMWFPFYQTWSKQFRVLVPTHPGFGQSAGFDQIDTIEDMAFHYVEMFDALGLDVGKQSLEPRPVGVGAGETMFL
jgi:pimeloyl-ACP methyl ester carboxylesterase